MPPEGEYKLQFKSDKFYVYDNGQWVDLGKTLASVTPGTFKPFTPWNHGHSYPLHVRYAYEEPSSVETVDIFVLPSWQTTPQILLEIHAKGSEGPVRTLSPARAEYRATSEFNAGKGEGHWEFYDYDGQILLELTAHEVEFSYQADWLHGEECLCPNKETLF